jgi:hypothetical protein
MNVSWLRSEDKLALHMKSMMRRWCYTVGISFPFVLSHGVFLSRLHQTVKFSINILLWYPALFIVCLF